MADCVDDDSYSEVGFLFERHLERTQKIFSFNDIDTTLLYVDDEPGALQSGHYLWPAAFLLASYLVNNPEKISDGPILELGAGSGLVGLTVAQLPCASSVVLTDHDHGVLELLQENINLQKRRDLFCHHLSWGNLVDEDIKKVRASLIPELQGGCDVCTLILGSDVIYAKSVVQPLFLSVKRFLSPKDGQFFMSQSFKYDDDTENEILISCEKLNLRKSVILDNLETGGGRILMFKYFYE